MIVEELVGGCGCFFEIDKAQIKGDRKKRFVQSPRRDTSWVALVRIGTCNQRVTVLGPGHETCQGRSRGGGAYSGSSGAVPLYHSAILH